MTNRNRSRPFCRLPSWQPECQVPHSGTLALSSVWHLALWHSAPFGTWHFGTQLRLALGTLALSSVWHLALWHSTCNERLPRWRQGLVIDSLAPPNSSIASRLPAKLYG